MNASHFLFSIFFITLLSACGSTSDPMTSHSPAQLELSDDLVTLVRGESLSVNVLENDLGSNLIITELDTTGFQGEASLRGDDIEIQALTDFTGVTTLKYKVMDAQSNTAWAEINVSILPASSIFIENDQALVKVNTQLMIDVLSNDRELNQRPLTLISITSASLGKVEIRDNQIWFEAADQPGSISLNYIVENPDGEQASGLLLLHVQSSLPPVAKNDYVNLEMGGSLVFNPVANDHATDHLSLQIKQIKIESGDIDVQIIDHQQLEFIANTSFEGTAIVRYQVSDALDSSDEGEIRVRVHPPIASLINFSIEDIQQQRLPSGYASYLYPVTTGGGGAWLQTRNIGDANRDGVDDIGFSFSNVDIDERDQEAVFTLYGTPNTTLAAEVSISELMNSALSSTEGQLLYHKYDALIGDNQQVDLNHDGYRDFIFSHMSGIGIYFGQENETQRIDLNDALIEFSTLDTQVGYIDEIGSADVNGDNIDDLIVRPSALNRSGQEQALYIYYGPITDQDSDLFSRSINAQTGALITGFSAFSVEQETLRFDVADMNDDGQNDLIIGDINASHGSESAQGALYLFWQTNALPAEINIENLAQLNAQKLGFATTLTVADDTVAIGSVIRHADINGDNIQDLILGYSDPDNLHPERSIKQVWVVDGVNQWPEDVDLSTSSLPMHSIIAQDYSPYITSVVPTSINGDPYADLVITYLQDHYIVLGGSTLRPKTLDVLNTNWPMITITSYENTESILSMDLNHDEFKDLVLTTQAGSTTKAYIVYGGLHYNFIENSD